jgi:Tfp pilus assembly protein PilX
MSKKKANAKPARNEKGAALVTVLMISLILLVASAGILLECN